MKKRLVLCVLIAQCLMLGACGAEKESSPVTITPVETAQETETEVKEETKEEKEEPETIIEEANEPVGMFASKATIEETTLVDQDGVKIVANSIDYTDSRATLHVTVENNTDKDLSFLSGTLGYSMNTINGCVVSDGYLNVDVAAGMKALDEIYFDKDSLVRCGITDIGEIGMSFYVNDDDYKELLRTDLITIPTSIYDKIDYTEDTIKAAINDGIWENELRETLPYINTDFECSQDGLNINAVVIAETQYDSTNIYLELENTTDETVVFTSSDITLNGVTASSGRWDSYHIPAKKRALAEFKIDYLIDEEFSTLLSKDKIGSLSFTLSKVEADSYDTISEANVAVVFDESFATVEIDGDPIYDANGITFYLLPVAEDEYGMDYFIPIYIKNRNGSTIIVDLDDGTMAVDGYMLDSNCFSKYINDGQDTVLKIDINQDKAAALQINSVGDFTSAKCKFEIKNEHYSKIDNPTVELNFK